MYSLQICGITKFVFLPKNFKRLMVLSIVLSALPLALIYCSTFRMSVKSSISKVGQVAEKVLRAGFEPANPCGKGYPIRLGPDLPAKR